MLNGFKLKTPFLRLSKGLILNKSGISSKKTAQSTTELNYCGILSAIKMFWNENLCSRSAFRR